MKLKKIYTEIIFFSFTSLVLISLIFYDLSDDNPKTSFTGFLLGLIFGYCSVLFLLLNKIYNRKVFKILQVIYFPWNVLVILIFIHSLDFIGSYLIGTFICASFCFSIIEASKIKTEGK